MRHPVASLLRHHAHAGSVPTAAELAELKLPADAVSKITAAACEARELRSQGENGQADRLAHESAQEIVSGLPKKQQDPAYLKPDPNAAIDGMGPAELAALILL